MTTPLFIGGLGPPEMILIALVLILLFGASKLPKLARSMGSATGEFKKGRQEVEEELQEMQDPSNEDGVTEAEAGTATGTETGTQAETEPETEPEPEPDTDRSNV